MASDRGIDAYDTGKDAGSLRSQEAPGDQKGTEDFDDSIGDAAEHDSAPGAKRSVVREGRWSKEDQTSGPLLLTGRVFPWHLNVWDLSYELNQLIQVAQSKDAVASFSSTLSGPSDLENEPGSSGSASERRVSRMSPPIPGYEDGEQDADRKSRSTNRRVPSGSLDDTDGGAVRRPAGSGSSMRGSSVAGSGASGSASDIVRRDVTHLQKDSVLYAFAFEFVESDQTSPFPLRACDPPVRSLELVYTDTETDIPAASADSTAGSAFARPGQTQQNSQARGSASSTSSVSADTDMDIGLASTSNPRHTGRLRSWYETAVRWNVLNRDLRAPLMLTPTNRVHLGRVRVQGTAPKDGPHSVITDLSEVLLQNADTDTPRAEDPDLTPAQLDWGYGARKRASRGGYLIDEGEDTTRASEADKGTKAASGEPWECFVYRSSPSQTAPGVSQGSSLEPTAPDQGADADVGARVHPTDDRLVIALSQSVAVSQKQATQQVHQPNSNRTGAATGHYRNVAPFFAKASEDEKDDPTKDDKTEKQARHDEEQVGDSSLRKLFPVVQYSDGGVGGESDGSGDRKRDLNEELESEPFLPSRDVRIGASGVLELRQCARVPFSDDLFAPIPSHTGSDHDDGEGKKAACTADEQRRALRTRMLFRETWERALGKRPRVIAIGDVHGCIQEVIELLRLADFQPGDQVIFTGDLVAKGPDSLGVVRLARQINARMVRGNHDHEVIRWREAVMRGARPPIVSVEHSRFARGMSEEDFEWFRSAPWYISSTCLGHVFVHAGMIPGVEMWEQNPRLMMNMRSILPDGVVTAKHVSKHGWARLWRGPLKVVFGHDALRGLQQHEFAVGLDTGCVYGGRLSALLLPENRLISVKAQRSYIQQRRKIKIYTPNK
ncbi:Bis(5'-nucleosyl)-tetraphosphatase PrpE, asymmetrical [Porphyridium purpureum]|uniref:Bis(5'-nucleosyl)-tetraphosphatase PrpE, asymmetrical n=1 Tax=Porphyridium purpureum TaxID=35688 RepID=A0A5J4Z4C7_PORPP|nr:Bis(5'-nucleosyl)-tetraphosphatase PrpE, asymmetrical [Porphyridium purpureum]|eukprot:POR7237..scf295_1